MYGALLALISCASAWVYWRRHPLYSQTASVRVLTQVLLLSVAAGSAIYTVVTITAGKSIRIQMAVLFLIIVLVTLAMIFSISAVSTPKSARLNTTLPLNVSPINLYRRRIRRFLTPSLVFLAMTSVAGLIPGPVRYISASALAISVLLACILLPTAYVTARRLDRAATAMTLQPWLHWHYSPEEWQIWKAASVQRFEATAATFVLKRDWHRMLWVSSAIFAGALLLTPGSWLARVLWAAVCIGMVLLFVEAAAWDARRGPRKLEARLAQCLPDAYFGDDGMICEGLLFTWLGADMYLTAAGMDEREPRSVLMEFERIVPNAYGSPNAVMIRQGVPIPRGSGPNDLALLRASLQSRCPNATISMEVQPRSV